MTYRTIALGLVLALQQGTPKESPKPIPTTKDICGAGDCVFTASPALTGKYFLVLSNPDDGVTIQEFPADKDRQKRYEVSMSSDWLCKATADDFNKPSVVAMVCTRSNVPDEVSR